MAQNWHNLPAGGVMWWSVFPDLVCYKVLNVTFDILTVTHATGQKSSSGGVWYNIDQYLWSQKYITGQICNKQTLEKKYFFCLMLSLVNLLQWLIWSRAAAA